MARRFLRDNAFLVAAVLLPVIVIGVFLLFTVIPQWTVAPPEYDLLVYTTEYDQHTRHTSVELFVRADRLQATVRPTQQGFNPARVRLWRFDHQTMGLREIALDLPDDVPTGGAITTDVQAMEGRRIVADAKAPDGYEFRTPSQSGPGVVGDLFGMRRYDRSVVLVHRGRVVPIKVPTGEAYRSPAFLGWLTDGGR